MCDDWYVVSIDAANIYRVLFRGPSDDVCEQEAIEYCACERQPGEHVIIGCAHNYHVQRALMQPPPN